MTRVKMQIYLTSNFIKYKVSERIKDQLLILNVWSSSSFSNLKFLFNRFYQKKNKALAKRIHPLYGGGGGLVPFIERFVTSLILFKVQTMGSIKGPIPYNVWR